MPKFTIVTHERVNCHRTYEVEAPTAKEARTAMRVVQATGKGGRLIGEEHQGTHEFVRVISIRDATGKEVG